MWKLFRKKDVFYSGFYSGLDLPKRTREQVEQDLELTNESTRLLAQKRRQRELESRQQELELQQRLRLEQFQVERMRSRAQAAFLRNPAASVADFERCWPALRDEMFKQDALRALAEMADDADALPSFGGEASLEQNVTSLRLISSNDNLQKSGPRKENERHLVGLDPGMDEGKAQRLDAALLHAARGGDPHSVNTVLAFGANVNARDEGGWTSLVIATIKGHVEVVRALLDQGADVNATDAKGWTALRFAVSICDVEMMKMLADGGADLNASDRDGWTPLMQATNEHNLESLKFLLLRGADVNLRNAAGDSALAIAMRSGHAETAKALIIAGAE